MSQDRAEEIAEKLRELHQAATGGKWILAAKPSSVVGWPIASSPIGRSICNLTYVQRNQIDPVVAGDRAFNAEARANGELIVTLRNLLPEIIAALADKEPTDADT